LKLHERISAEFSTQLRSRGAAATGDTAIDLEALPEVVDLDRADPDRTDDPLSPSA
jgi:hypothetical protein